MLEVFIFSSNQTFSDSATLYLRKITDSSQSEPAWPSGQLFSNKQTQKHAFPKIRYLWIGLSLKPRNQDSLIYMYCKMCTFNRKRRKVNSRVSHVFWKHFRGLSPATSHTKTWQKELQTRPKETTSGSGSTSSPVQLLTGSAVQVFSSTDMIQAMLHVCTNVNVYTVLHMLNVGLQWEQILHSIFLKSSYNPTRERPTKEANRNHAGYPQKKLY